MPALALPVVPRAHAFGARIRHGCLGFVMAVIWEPWFRLVIGSVVSRGLATLWDGCRMIAWIRDSSNSGAPGSGLGECLSSPEGSRPLWGGVEHGCVDS